MVALNKNGLLLQKARVIPKSRRVIFRFSYKIVKFFFRKQQFIKPSKKLFFFNFSNVKIFSVSFIFHRKFK